MRKFVALSCDEVTRPMPAWSVTLMYLMPAACLIQGPYKLELRFRVGALILRIGFGGSFKGFLKRGPVRVSVRV